MGDDGYVAGSHGEGHGREHGEKAQEHAAAENQGTPVASTATAPATTEEGDAGRYLAGIQHLETGFDLTKVDVGEDESAPAQAPAGPADQVPAMAAASGQAPHGTYPVATDGMVQDQLPPGHLSMVEGEPEHDFGDLIQGRAASHTFRMVSDGENDLVISRIKPSCGCTVAQVNLVTPEGKAIYEEGQPIPPGTQFEIETGLKSDGRQGTMKTQVALYCNDPRSVFNLLLKAEVLPVLVLEPRTLNLGTTTSASVVNGSIKLTSSTLEPFHLEADPQFNVKPMSVELQPVSPDAEGRATEWDVNVTIGPDIPEGMRNYPIRLLTDEPVPDPKGEPKGGEQKTYQVVGYAQVSVTGLVSAQPAFISFGMVRPGQVVERTIRIECHDDFKLPEDMPVKLVGLLKGEEFPYDEAFSHTLTTVEEGRLFDLVLRLEGLPENSNGSFGGQLKVDLGHPHKKELVIRFSGVCRPGLPDPRGASPPGGAGSGSRSLDGSGG